jgi:uncharacterized protein (TIGR00730 family)
MKRVTVFGGSQTREGEPDYQAAMLLGQLLGQAGFAVLTGGYIGTMEAVSRGAAEAGGQVIGVTCDQIEAWRAVRPNRWVQQEMRYATLRDRMFALIDESDAVIAMPGGPGTLAEVAVLWNHLLTSSVAPRPFILVGPGWRHTLEQFYAAFDAYIPEAQRKWLSFAPDVRAAVQLLLDANHSR